MTDNDAIELLHLTHSLTNEILEIRDRLMPITSKEIEREKCPPGTIHRGRRKTTLKDAESIARHAIARIDQIVNQYHADTERFWK